MTRDGSVACSLSNSSRSIRDALLEKTLKLTPRSEAVAPSGALAPGATPPATVTVSSASFGPTSPSGARDALGRPWRAPLCRPCWRSDGAWFDPAVRNLGDVLWSRFPHFDWMLISARQTHRPR